MTRDFSQKQYLLFDLDGTLTDSKDGITRSAQYALGQLGIQVEDPQQLVSFVGRRFGILSCNMAVSVKHRPIRLLFGTASVFKKQECLKTAYITAFLRCLRS